MHKRNLKKYQIHSKNIFSLPSIHVENIQKIVSALKKALKTIQIKKN